MSKQLLLKLKRNIFNILAKGIDNNIWVIKDEDEKVETLHFACHIDQILKVYNEDVLETILSEFPERHKFIFHSYSSYVYNLDNTILEPTHGWIILGKYYVFKFSFPLVGDPWRPKPLLPSYIRFTLGIGKSIFLEEAISVRYGWENYYHFFIDVLGQIYMIESNGVPLEIPILVPYYFDSIAFVQEFLAISPLIKRRIIVQKKNEYYHVKKLIVSKDTFISEGVKEVVHSVDHLRELYRNDKIFLYRPTNHGRSIINNLEISLVAEKYGFLPIDSSSLSLTEQIALFSGASQLVGIHGAGLTNIIFRYGHELSILEIFPNEALTPEHYKNLSNFLSFDYKFLIGENADEKFNFYLDPSKFELELEKFC